MSRLNELDVIYFDESEGEEYVFRRKEYYFLVCGIVTEFFHWSMPENGFHERFVDLLNDVEIYDDVVNITSEMPYYWAMCIIEGGFTRNGLTDSGINAFIKFSAMWRSKTGVIYYTKPVRKDRSLT